MTIIQLLILIVVAAVCGAVGQGLAGYSTGGCFLSTVVGFIGAYLGMWLSRQLGLPELFVLNVGGESFPVIWSIIGSAILALLLGIMTRLGAGNRRRV
jgi:uncharacterized membrane protein YeaQ/YmgE (transglycosylase-associated protein family)